MSEVNVVSVMAHQDDELVCLDTMLKMLERGDRLHFICVTDCSGGMAHAPEMTLQEAAAVRDLEMRALADALGATCICLGEHDESCTIRQMSNCVSSRPCEPLRQMLSSPITARSTT